ncbi:MAG: polyprenyl synthetase family protein [Thermodesulfovibrio sp.]|jgi:octaprenyl-diphosphate synthase|uniref:polyprenyl synthetase family protein n=1 Tax=unclassified Thermodesulfovibrio TaxID=2645936 RepID=UPI00083A9E0D|nr:MULTISPECIES: polyprenyl synthetase family protein [unclassified Thermodesulfovibrio]MDI1471340.1 polyprenyl synthetase family protein [Thermodesulfovibrio sp. 1176]MDI6714635.1 polyprenyl synthetase family protein [Thermodesulfovibrio sp.]ODA43840.1 Octaprenyl diphosphate synthase [Thermodesulfovibrio sp. N1]
MNFHEIFRQYEDELREVEKELSNIFQSEATLIPTIGAYIINSGGKRLRPLFLLLCSDLVGYKGYKRIILASVIEALHTASLLHDDVVDEAEVRRGKKSANKIWGNQVTVLLGDYLYAKALHISVAQESLPIMEALSLATSQMAEGEILQLMKAGDPTITFEEYIKIITGKTAGLITAACRIAGLLASLSEDKIKALTDFGHYIGIAFQMVDDILDYVADEQALGKKLGKDLMEGKITLPLIELLKKAKEKEEIIDIIKSEKFSAENLSLILKYLQKYNCIESSMLIVKDYIEKAKKVLEVFPDSVYRRTLMTIADYILQRNK